MNRNKSFKFTNFIFSLKINKIRSADHILLGENCCFIQSKAI